MSTTTSIWDAPELKANDGEYVKFVEVGDTVTGKIVSQHLHTFDDGKVVPQIILDCDGEQRTLTAGQVRLKAALAEQRPATGDTLTVTLTQIEKRSGTKTLKHFDVTVARAGAATPAPHLSAVDGKEQANRLLGL